MKRKWLDSIYFCKAAEAGAGNGFNTISTTITQNAKSYKNING